MAIHSLDRHDLLRGRVAHKGGSVEVTLEGEVDLSNAEILGGHLRGLSELNPGDLDLDIAGLEFIDSLGLRVLAGAQRELGTAGRRLIVQNAPAHVRRLLAISGLDALLNVE